MLDLHSPIPFGKMRGKLLYHVFNDIEYMDWMIREANPSRIMSLVIKLFYEYRKEEELYWNHQPEKRFEEDINGKLYLIKKEKIWLPRATELCVFHFHRIEACKYCKESKVVCGGFCK